MIVRATPPKRIRPARKAKAPPSCGHVIYYDRRRKVVPQWLLDREERDPSTVKAITVHDIAAAIEAERRK